MKRLQEDGVEAHLAVHGANLELQPDDFRAEFQQLLEATEATVTFEGEFNHDDLPALMADADWVVVPSVWWENSPLVIQEASQHRRPIIASDIGGMAEKVHDGVSGLQFTAGDPSSLAETIARAVSSRRLWDELQRKIQPVYAMDDHVRSMSRHYNELLAQKSDDRLLPRAVELGVDALRANPHAAFAFGRYRRIAADGLALQGDEQPRPTDSPYSLFLRYNYAGMPATGIFRRSALDEVGYFDTDCDAAEDYELGLRLSRQFPVEPHGEYVAEYRIHGGGMSRQTAKMLRVTLGVLGRERKHVRRKPKLREAYRAGRRFWREYYGDPLVGQVRESFANGEWGDGLRGLGALVRHHPRGLPRLLVRPRAGGRRLDAPRDV